MTEDVILPLHSILAKPDLEDMVQFWTPHPVKEIVQLDDVQRRTIKIVSFLCKNLLKDRLCFNTFSLEKRHFQGKFIESFKMRYDFTNVSPSCYP